MKIKAWMLWVCLPWSVWADERYPLEFADFFLEQEETVEVVIAGEVRSLPVQALVTYETFQLKSTPDNLTSLQAYLLELGMTASAAKSVASTLLVGVAANPGCEGVLSQCVPQDLPGQAEYVFDFDARQLRVFVSSDLLRTQTGGREYHSAWRQENALVNQASVYVYADKDENTQLTWNNHALLGLPVGYVSLDTQYQQESEEWDVHEALYDVEVSDTRALLGYQGRTARALNTTDFLNYGATHIGAGITVGSSQNLLKGDKASVQRIYFFAPQAGQLEVYQGERLLLSRAVSQGQQFISYDQLPSGVYTISLVVRQGSQELVREQRQVVNSAQFALPVSEWDYRMQVGYLEDMNDVRWDSDEIDDASRTYGQAAVSYRATESLLVAGGMVGNRDALGWQVGGHWSPNAKLNAQYTTTWFDSGSSYQFAQLDWRPFTASVRVVDALDTSDTLSQLLYGQESSVEWGVGLSGEVLGGTGFLSYFNYQTEDEWTDSHNDNLSLSWSRDWLGGSVGVNVSYLMYDDQDDGWSSSLTWTRRFGEDLTGRMGVYVDDDGFSYQQSALTVDTQGEQWQASATAGAKLGPQWTTAELSGTLSGHSDHVQYSSYGYLNDQGQGSLSGTISGTQVVSRSGIATTHQRGQAFANITPTLTQKPERDIKVNYQLTRDKKYWYRGSVDADEAQMLMLSPYTEVGFELDADSSNAELTSRQQQDFVMPGMYYHLDTDVVPLQSQTFVFSDMQGAPIQSVRCLGEGCKSVEILSEDGVFRVNYRQGEAFKLVSDKRLCVYDPSLMGDAYVSAYCLPGLDDSADSIVWQEQMETAPSADSLLYIGKYVNQDEAKHMLTQLSEVGLKSKVVTVGEALYVYVRYQGHYTVAQRAILEGLEAYVIFDAVYPDELFSVR
ncbi:TcfC E-set like domain-containing protein [Vibrio campbellii]|uniref:TcfC E-set like domain-containing protein n=1 Tax=Vibrio campbellii TaxID=680 RepID=UPI00249B2551|nr:TcfC E-set like domain-containing protein [Vibrio campbellii]